MIPRLALLLLTVAGAWAQNTTYTAGDSNLVFGSGGSTLLGSWGGPNPPSFYDSNQCSGTTGSSLSGDYATLSFTGVFARVLTWSDKLGATASLYVDGAHIGDINTNVPGAYYANCTEATWGTTGTLPYGPHNFTIQQNENGMWLYIHSFEFSASLPPAPVLGTTAPFTLPFSLTTSASATPTTPTSGTFTNPFSSAPATPSSSISAPSSSVTPPVLTSTVGASSRSHTVEIVVSVLGVLALAVIAFLAFLLFKKRRRSRQSDPPAAPHAQVSSSFGGAAFRGEPVASFPAIGHPAGAQTTDLWSPQSFTTPEPIPQTPSRSLPLGAAPAQSVAVPNMRPLAEHTDESHRELSLPKAPRLSTAGPSSPPRSTSELRQNQTPSPISSTRQRAPGLDLIRDLMDRNVPERELNAVIRLVTQAQAGPAPAEHRNEPPPTYEQEA